MPLGNRTSDAIRFGPEVFGEGELVVMDGEDGFGLQVEDGLFQAFRRSMDKLPVVVVLPVFENG